MVWDRGPETQAHAVAAVAQLHGFQTGVRAALLLVQQTVEQDDGGFNLIGDTSRRTASTTVGTDRLLRRVRRCRWRMAGSMEV